MSKKSLFNFALFFFLFAASVSAQATSCSVKMEVMLNESEISIKGATATALNKKTKRVFKSVLKDGQPFFAKLPEGDYRVTATKAGYMRSVDDLSLDCTTAAEEDYSWLIELHKGSSAKIVRLYNLRRTEPLKTVIGVSSADLPTLKTAPSSEKETLPLSVRSQPVAVDSETVSGGVVNTKATNLVKPTYPPAARAVRASGAVNVQVLIDENGNVVSASAVSGHPLLRKAAEDAARASTFSPTLLSGEPVKVTGIIVYNFIP